MIICSFSDFNTPLNEAPSKLKGAKLHKWVIKNLLGRKRISCWEIGDNIKVCKVLMWMQSTGKIKFTDGYNYPYVGVEVRK